MPRRTQRSSGALADPSTLSSVPRRRRCAMRLGLAAALAAASSERGGAAPLWCTPPCASRLTRRSREPPSRWGYGMLAGRVWHAGSGPAGPALHCDPMHERLGGVTHACPNCLLQVDLSSLGRAFSGKTVEMAVPPGVHSCQSCRYVKWLNGRLLSNELALPLRAAVVKARRATTPAHDTGAVLLQAPTRACSCTWRACCQADRACHRGT